MRDHRSMAAPSAWITRHFEAPSLRSRLQAGPNYTIPTYQMSFLLSFIKITPFIGVAWAIAYCVSEVFHKNKLKTQDIGCELAWQKHCELNGGAYCPSLNTTYVALDMVTFHVLRLMLAKSLPNLQDGLFACLERYWHRTKYNVEHKPTRNHLQDIKAAS